MPSSIFLPFLINRFLAAGGTFSWRKVEDISKEAKSADLLINCTGYGAKKLCQDSTLEAAKGHVLVVANPGLQKNIVVSEKEKFTHIFPYGDLCVLGGIYQPGNTDLTPDTRITQDILERAALLEPALKNANMLAIRTGLRPLRPAVRLEIEALSDGGTVIHNYGHGGAGYTLARGCAEDVLTLVTNYFS